MPPKNYGSALSQPLTPPLRYSPTVVEAALLTKDASMDILLEITIQIPRGYTGPRTTTTISPYKQPSPIIQVQYIIMKYTETTLK